MPPWKRGKVGVAKGAGPPAHSSTDSSGAFPSLSAGQSETSLFYFDTILLAGV